MSKESKLTIYLETERSLETAGAFDLVWSVTEKGFYSQEVRGLYVCETRLEAALVNLGKACRDIYDNDHFFSVVELKADTDTAIRDYKYSDKYAHHTVYDLVVGSGDKYKDAKAISLFHEYERFVSKIKRLIALARISVRIV